MLTSLTRHGSAQIPVRQLWNFKAFSRRKDLSQVLHLYLYSWSSCWIHKRREGAVREA